MSLRFFSPINGSAVKVTQKRTIKDKNGQKA